MSDALKSLPASPTLTISVAGSSTIPTASAATAGLPPAFANITAGTVIAGIVIERARGTIVLKTDNGLLKLATSLAVRLGAEITLEVQSVGAQMRFAVVAVDQHAPSAPSALESGQAAAAKALLPELSEPADTKAADRTTVAGRLVTATIVAPPESGGRAIATNTVAVLLSRMTSLSAAVGNAGASSSNGAMAQTLPLIPGTDALEKILSALGPLPPEVVEALLNEPTSATTATVTGDTSKTQAPAPETETAAPLSVTSENDADGSAMLVNRQVTIRLLDVLAPMMAGSRPIPLRAAGTRNDSITLAGNVVSNDGNEIEVATALGKLRLPLSIEIEPGSQIAFEVVAQADNLHEPGLGPQAPATAASLPSRTLAAEPAHDWPALRDLDAAVGTMNPPMDPSVTESLLPKAGTTLGPSMLALFAAMRSGGNARAWLGKAAVDALDATTRDKLLQRLTAELSAEAKASALTDKAGWQTMAVPVIDGERLNEIRFHFQKRRQGKDGKDESQGNRFIIETTLSALGPLQLDGLVRMKRFDLIVRTERPMPDAMRRDIETLFARTLSESDYLGGVSFRGDMTQAQATTPATPRNAGVLA